MYKYQVFLYKSTSGKKIIEDFINNCDKESVIRIRNAINLLREYGFNLLSHQMLKKINKNPALFELRIKTKEEIRLLLFFSSPNNFIIVHGFVKKTNKLPRQDLKLALKRTREFI